MILCFRIFLDSKDPLRIEKQDSLARMTVVQILVLQLLTFFHFQNDRIHDTTQYIIRYTYIIKINKNECNTDKNMKAKIDIVRLVI